MKKTSPATARRQTRRNSPARSKLLELKALPPGTQQALMGLAAFEARRTPRT